MAERDTGRMQKSLQIKQLRRSILGKTGIYAVIYTVAFIILFIVFDEAVKPFIANTLRWQIFSNDYEYFFISDLYFPLVLISYIIGLALIIKTAVDRALSYFSRLFEAVESVFVARDQAIELPPELAPTALALNAIRTESERNERAAKAAEQRKNELVVYLAHDIKTPLTSIIGYLSLLEESPDLPLEQRARYAHITLEKAYRLEELLDEFFEITRFNLQSIPIERSHVDISLLCNQVLEEFYPQASEKSIRFKLEAPDDLIVFVDASRLARIIDNLLKNAIAYADRGSEIVVEARLEQSGPQSNEHLSPQRLMVTVTNEGREISAENLEHIFEKFYRGDKARSSSSGGAGLGLAISQEIARAHGGDITAASDQGKTHFIVNIPLA